MIRNSIVIFLVAISFMSNAQTKTPNKFGKGLYNVVAEDSSFSMKVGLRFQNLFVGEWDVEDGDLSNGSSNFLIRRSRLKFDGFAFSPKLKYKVEIGLSNRDLSGVSPETKNAPRLLLDAVLQWNFAGNFELWAGQTKLPGNRERVVSSGNLQFVDRSQLNSKYTLDRDFGIQLRHHHKLNDNFVVKEIFSLAQGEGRNITAGNIGGHDYTGRIELLPFGEFTKKGDYSGSDLKRESKPKLAIGATYDYNKGASKTQGQNKSFMYIDNGDDYYQTDLKTFFVDFMFKYNGLSVMGEYANRKADDPIAKNSDGTLTGDKVYVGEGINLQAGYLLKNDWEVAGRYTRITPEDVIGKNPFDQYTLGVSRFIVGHKLKVQSDVSYLNEENKSGGELMYRLQFDIHF